MKFLKRFIEYMNPSVDPKVKKDIDRQSLRSIYVISLIVLIFEIMTLAVFLVRNITHLDHSSLVSLVSVCFCILLCAAGCFLSGRMMQRKDLSHRNFFLFKATFFVLFTVWAIFVDYRHYKAGDQMLTYYTVNLVMVCFIIFRPWIGMILVGASYISMYAAVYSVDRAAGIEPLNYIMFMLASIACNTVRCHGQINSSIKAIRLIKNNAALETASRRDGLTGLLNRLALEEDAKKMDGRRMTAYMIDINYFKEINDRYGHSAGDAILRKTSETLKKLYPGGRYYRYGGDEFLVLTYKPAEENYGFNTYGLEADESGPRAFLSIGNAQASPADYQALFDLISAADKALYVTKQRTHSAEFGGHDRRKSSR